MGNLHVDKCAWKVYWPSSTRRPFEFLPMLPFWTGSSMVGPAVKWTGDGGGIRAKQYYLADAELMGGKARSLIKSKYAKRQTSSTLQTYSKHPKITQTIIPSHRALTDSTTYASVGKGHEGNDIRRCGTHFNTKAWSAICCFAMEWGLELTSITSAITIRWLEENNPMKHLGYLKMEFNR